MDILEQIKEQINSMTNEQVESFIEQSELTNFRVLGTIEDGRDKWIVRKIQLPIEVLLQTPVKVKTDFSKHTTSTNFIMSIINGVSKNSTLFANSIAETQCTTLQEYGLAKNADVCSYLQK